MLKLLLLPALAIAVSFTPAAELAVTGAVAPGTAEAVVPSVIPSDASCRQSTAMVWQPQSISCDTEESCVGDGDSCKVVKFEVEVIRDGLPYKNVYSYCSCTAPIGSHVDGWGCHMVAFQDTTYLGGIPVLSPFFPSCTNDCSGFVPKDCDYSDDFLEEDEVKCSCVR